MHSFLFDVFGEFQKNNAELQDLSKSQMQSDSDLEHMSVLPGPGRHTPLELSGRYWMNFSEQSRKHCSERVMYMPVPT